MTYRYLPSFGLRVLQLVILLESLIRGIAYIVSPIGVPSATDITASAPLGVWGVAFTAFAVLGFFGEALMSGTSPDIRSGGGNPRAWPSFIAHAGLMILYLTMFVGYGGAVIDGDLALAAAPGAMLTFAFLHWLFARRRKHHAT
ncbi:minor tail protein [Mycobacterium phage HINdeR]|uniref:Minor tail protein n=1 Tax=Mycobacterium phage HINdeR TaxID=1327770 RepID=R4JEV8_9CAUD|nr:minor tail protein [Mycobacterium phage HINdeR]AGK87508.1 minor tail protein [Mycobacterium phage HINdeR]